MDDSQTHLSTTEPERGNTKFRARGYCFTLNNPEKDDPQHIKMYFEHFKAIYVFQEETGEEGTKHLQGFVQFQNATQFKTVKMIMPKAHIEPAKNWKKSKLYCSKIDTRSGACWTNIPGLNPVEVPKIELYPWQKELVEILKTKADDRSIHWIWESKGCVGKTTFAKWFILTYPEYNAIYLNSGKTGDLMFAMSKAKPSVVFIDVPRTQMDRFNYQALEQIKNGIFFSSKYESAMTIMTSPHVVVFANVPPTLNAMSLDRWLVKELQ